MCSVHIFIYFNFKIHLNIILKLCPSLTFYIFLYIRFVAEWLLALPYSLAGGTSPRQYAAALRILSRLHNYRPFPPSTTRTIKIHEVELIHKKTQMSPINVTYAFLCEYGPYREDDPDAARTSGNCTAAVWREWRPPQTIQETTEWAARSGRCEVSVWKWAKAHLQLSTVRPTFLLIYSKLEKGGGS